MAERASRRSVFLSFVGGGSLCANLPARSTLCRSCNRRGVSMRPFQCVLSPKIPVGIYDLGLASCRNGNGDMDALSYSRSDARSFYDRTHLKRSGSHRPDRKSVV